MAVYKLKDICLKIGSGATPRGGKEAYCDEGISLIRSQNVLDFTFSHDGLAHINEKQAEKLSNVEVKSQDILLNITGDSVARACAVDVRVLPARVNQHVAIIRPNEDEVLSSYILFYLQMMKPYLLQIAAGGATRNALTKGMIENLELEVPDILFQKKIVSILDDIQEKIRENKEINKNLLEQAQAIYTKMFITDADSLWPEGKLSDLIEVCYGKDHKKLHDGDIPVYGSGGIMRHVDRALYEQESVLVPRKGTLNNVMYVNEPFWSVDTMFFTKMKRQNVAKFVFHFLKGKDLASMNAGSAVPSMTTKILNAIPLQIPDDQTLSTFEAQVSPFYQTASYNNKESENLAAIRDSLLPKLMSGEIDVSDIDL